MIAFGSRPLAAGLLAGLGLAIAASRVLHSSLVGLLYELSPFDFSACAAVLVLLTVTGMVAVAGPAWRSTLVDPIVALRQA